MQWKTWNPLIVNPQLEHNYSKTVTFCEGIFRQRDDMITSITCSILCHLWARSKYIIFQHFTSYRWGFQCEHFRAPLALVFTNCSWYKTWVTNYTCTWARAYPCVCTTYWSCFMHSVCIYTLKVIIRSRNFAYAASWAEQLSGKVSDNTAPLCRLGPPQ